MSRWRFTSLRGRLARVRGSGSVASGAPPALAASRHLQQIHAEQVRLLFEQLPSALIATTIVGGLVVYVLWGHVPRLWLATWWVGFALTTSARIWLWRAYFKARPPASEVGHWARRFLVGVMISGVMWGIAGVFPVAPDHFIERDVPGVCAGRPGRWRHVDLVVVSRRVCGISGAGDPAVRNQDHAPGRRSVRRDELDADLVHRDDVADFGDATTNR